MGFFIASTVRVSILPVDVGYPVVSQNKRSPRISMMTAPSGSAMKVSAAFDQEMWMVLAGPSPRTRTEIVWTRRGLR